MATVTSRVVDGLKQLQFDGPVDVIETTEVFLFLLDCPGLSTKDVKVQVVDGCVVMTGERLGSHTVSSLLHRSERPRGTFTRKFQLPESADPHKISVVVDHGVLTVTVPKREEHGVEPVRAPAAEYETEGDGSLNEEFSQIPISSFPQPSHAGVITLKSDMPLTEAVNLLSEQKILAAPVRDVTKPDSAPWHEKYLGILDMVGVVLYMLDELSPEGKDPLNFQAEVEKCTAFRRKTVRDATRAGAFIALDVDRDNLLDCMFLCGQHGVHRIPVVHTGGDICNIITQSALVQTLYANLGKFKSLSKKKLVDIGLGSPHRILAVTADQPLRAAFKLIHDYGVSGVPVVDGSGYIKGNISARDVRYIFSSDKIFSLLNMPVQQYLSIVHEGSDHGAAVVCNPTDSLESVIHKLVKSRVHRIYVVDEHKRPMRVLSLSSILKKFTKEPQGHFEMQSKSS